MENDNKKNINNASLIDLKAELFRKHEEFKLQRNASGSFVKGRTQEKTKPDLFSRKNKGVLERAQKDYEEKIEEEDVHAKSRRALEAKAKLYEKIASSSDIPEEDGSQLYLVDFQKKVIDSIVETRNREGNDSKLSVSDNQDGKNEPLMEDIPPPSDPQEEWVDYVDSLGRSRRCMRKDLSKLVKQDKDMARIRGEVRQPVTKETAAAAVSEDTPTLMSSDMHRELLRQKWEKEEQEALGNTNIHYANVQFDEIRTHGVGFYQFDKSDGKRQEQMNTLNKLREQTVDERGRRERLKEKRKAMLDARLAKVKQRRKLKEGVVLADNKDDEEEIGPKLEEMLTGKRNEGEKKVAKAQETKETEPLKRDDSWRKDAPVREWDQGKDKKAVLSEEKYMSERRDERQAEFAPPSAYFDSSPPRHTTQNKPGSNTTQQKGVFGSKPAAETSAYETLKVEEVDVGSIPLPKNTKHKTEDDEPETHQGSLDTSYPAEYSTPFVPLPDVSLPPPGYPHVTQWTQPVGGAAACPVLPSVSVLESVLPDTSIPPPGVPPVQCSAQQTSVEVPQPTATLSVPNQTSHTRSANTAVSYDAKPAVYVPRASVLDTRLVQNVDADIITNSYLPEIQAEPYKPGSFTAALQAEHKAMEDVATASRDRTHFKGGPVIYKRMSHETDSNSETNNLNKLSSKAQKQNTEDEVTAFLKEIREST